MLVFAVQVVIGTALFMLIAAVVVALNVCAHWPEDQHLIDGLIGTILHSVEILILCVDAGLFVLYILVEAVVLIREMWEAVGGRS